MEQDERQERRDRRREKERSRMVVHKVKSPRSGERLVKLVMKHALKAQGIRRPKGVRGVKARAPR
jgi:hypothetical protein